MDFNIIVAQIFGILVLFTGILSYYKTSTKEVLIYNAITNGLSALQYVFLGAYTGAVCLLIAIIRNIVFSLFKKDIPLIYLIIFIVVLILTNFKLVHSVIDIIPIINVFIYTIALWTKDIMSIKKIGLIACIDGVVFNLYKHAYTGVLYEIVFSYTVVKSYRELRKEQKKLK